MRVVEIFMQWGLDWPTACTAAVMLALAGAYIGGCLGKRIADKQIAKELSGRS